MASRHAIALAKAAPFHGGSLTVRLADRIDGFAVETSLEVAQKSRALEARGVRVIHFEVGEPDFDTPPHVARALEASLRAGETRYTSPLGLPELRAAVAADATRRLGVPYAPGETIITHGGKPILFFTLLSCTNPGDEVLIPDPGYPIYSTSVRFLGGVPVTYGFDSSNPLRLDVGALAARVTPRTRALILNSPHNPTGVVHSDDDLRAIAEVAVRHDLWVLSDEIYGRIVYEGHHRSIASLPGMKERTVILDGFSKTFAMTGWRLGYGLAPAPLIAHFGLLMTHTTSCVSVFVQRGGVAALEGGDAPLQAMLAEFARRRSRIVEGLRAIPGVRCDAPGGAFYVFPDLSALGLTARAAADRLLDVGVAVVPGTSFGARGASHVRLSFACSLETIDEGLERIAEVAAAAPGRR
jgi:aspartate/methionine/tyrosine aminotransferase